MREDKENITEITEIETEESDGYAHDTSLAKLDPSGRLYNEDLAPTAPDSRKWNTYSLFALWMNDAHNLGDYAFAAALFALGLNAWQVTTSIFAGCLIIFAGCVMSGFMGRDTGLPFAAVQRISWGVFGANIPALIRAIAAILWYGIQTYLASAAINAIFLRFIPGMESLTHASFLGLDLLSWLSFIILWAIQLAILSRGMEAVRHFQGWAGPAVWAVMIAVAVSLVIQAGGNISLTASTKNLSAGQQLYHVLAGVGLMIGLLSTLMLNFSDFARFAPSRRAVVWGNFWGLPVNWTLFGLTSVVISAGSVAVYGRVITNPADIFQQMDSGILVLVGAITLALAALGVNIVANFVSPAYDLANVWPKHINFRRGGIITAVIALASLPWKLYSTPVIITYFLGGVGALMGPLFGVMAIDYFILRRESVRVPDLFTPNSRSIYYDRSGVNPLAVAAFIPSAILSLIVAFVPAFSSVAPFTWFVGVSTSALIYYAISRGRITPARELSRSVSES
jgi:nucleobase:cation symporter-1, NCS1 family